MVDPLFWKGRSPKTPPPHAALQHKPLMTPERREAFPCIGPGPCKRTVPFCEGFQISAGRDGAPRTSWLTRLARRQPAPRAVGLAPASRNSNPPQAPATEGTIKKSQTCASAFPPTRESPILSGEMPVLGARFQGLLPPIVVRPSFAIRKKASAVFPLEVYVEQGIMTTAQAAVLRAAIRETHDGIADHD